MNNEEVKERLKNQIKKLEDLQKVGCIDFFGVIDYHKSILKELERLEKLEKAIEIIKNKNVDVKLFIGIIIALKENEKALEYYNCVNNEQLTKQEFDLLNEVFKNDR